MSRPRVKKSDNDANTKAPNPRELLESIIWHVIENTEYRAKPPLSDKARFEGAMKAIYGTRDGPKLIDDKRHLWQIHTIVSKENISVSKAIDRAIETLGSPDKNHSPFSTKQRLARKYRDSDFAPIDMDFDEMFGESSQKFDQKKSALIATIKKFMDDHFYWR